jgi:hypothetical protein
MNKTTLRNFLGDLPLAAELDWSLRGRNRARQDHYNLDRLQKSLPGAAAKTMPFAKNAAPGKDILFFATLHYWIEQSAYLSLVLAGLGHRVTLMTLPYSEWHKRMDSLTQRQRVLHTRDALASLEPLVRHVSMLELNRDGRARAAHRPLPAALQSDVREISLWDAQ